MVLCKGVSETKSAVAPSVAKPALEQKVAFVELQVRVVDCPAVTLVGLAESEAVGLGCEEST